MEVDDDNMTSQLLQSFSSMQTQDRHESIVQMRRLVGGEPALSEAKATFYLEMANWSVPAAVGYYFDLENTQDSAVRELMPSMSFVADVTVGDGESASPSTSFLKTWTIRNSGSDSWPPGCILKLSSGHGMQVSPVGAIVPPLGAGATSNLTIQMTAPAEPGIYESQWRLATATGKFFGDPIWSIVQVEPSGTLAVTQQLNNLHCVPNNFNSVTATNTIAPPPRPTSPTDRLPVVNSRSVLSRGLDSSGQGSTMETMDEDEMVQ